MEEIIQQDKSHWWSKTYLSHSQGYSGVRAPQHKSLQKQGKWVEACRIWYFAEKYSSSDHSLISSQVTNNLKVLIAVQGFVIYKQLGPAAVPDEQAHQTRWLADPFSRGSRHCSGHWEGKTPTSQRMLSLSKSYCSLVGTCVFLPMLVSLHLCQGSWGSVLPAFPSSLVIGKEGIFRNTFFFQVMFLCYKTVKQVGQDRI